MRHWWTVREVAEHYAMSVRSIYDAISGGKLAVHRIGRGRGGMRISEENRLDWERRCEDLCAVRPSFVSRTRALKPDPVLKHFGP